jgi:hypothetical protein
MGVEETRCDVSDSVTSDLQNRNAEESRKRLTLTTMARVRHPCTIVIKLGSQQARAPVS